MPFKKIGKDRYQSPSGRTFTGAQVRLYYAGGGRFPGQSRKGRRASRRAARRSP